MSEQDSQSDQERKKRELLKMFLGVLVGLALTWFIVEAFLPAPLPHLAH